MKKLLLTVICCLFLMAAQAQNWQPVREGWVYSYKSCMSFSSDGILNFPRLTDTLSNCIHNVWIDSVTVLGADTVFSLNQIVKDTSTTWYPILSDGQAGFLQYKMYKNADGSYLFSTPDSFLIKPYETLGSGWLFNQIDSAYVISVSTDTIFGQADSIKKIIIANTDTIVISKNWGIIQFPNWETGDYYRLVGVQNDSNSNGLKIPDFWDVFDLQVGDVLMYGGYNWEGPSQPDAHSCSHKLKVEITGVTIQSDSIVIQSNSLHNNCLYYMENCTGGVSDLYYTNQAVLKVSDYQFLKLYNAGESGDFINYIDSKDEFEGQLSKILTTTWCHVEFVEGLGLTYSSFAGIGFDGYIQLIGYIHNGDTTGIIYSDSLTVLDVGHLTQISSQAIFNAKLQPNPSPQSTFVHFAEVVESDIIMEIYNLQGQLLQSKEFRAGSNRYEIDGNQLAPGFYLIRLMDERGRMQVLKWVRE